MPSGALGGTWSTDGSTIVIDEILPYGNSCHMSAPATPTGFASAAAPSTDVTCTFTNGLRPNPRRAWYALKLADGA